MYNNSSDIAVNNNSLSDIGENFTVNDEYVDTPLAFKIVNSLICSIFALCYLFIIIFILLNKKVLKNSFNIILLSLSVADLMALSFSLVSEIQLVKELLPYEPYVWIHAFFSQLIFYAELWHNLLISINRTVLIVLPKIYRKLDKMKYMLGQVIFIWIMATIWACPVVTNAGSLATKRGNYVETWEVTMAYQIAEITFSISSIVVSILIYVIMFLHIRKVRAKVASTLNEPGSVINSNASAGHSEIVILLQSFYISFTLGCLLFCSYSWFIFHDSGLEYYSMRVTSWFAYTSNPLMYTTLGSQFREIGKNKLSQLKIYFSSSL